MACRLRAEARGAVLAVGAATVLRVFTLGFVNPRRMVAVEVQKALLEASRMLNSTLWWVTVQVGLRIAFGLALWLTWALTKH